jgi:glycosyltransferase involved in cell wall biosynthesis
MRVALDVSAVPQKIAGAGRYCVELARRLPSVETATLVTRKDDGPRWQEFSPDATVVPLVPSSRLSRLLFEAARLGTSDPARNADVWHGPHYTMPRRGSTPTVVTIHDLTFFTNPEWHESTKVAFFTRAIEYSASHASVLVCVSEYTKHQLDEVVPVHAPVVVAHHGVDLVAFSTDSSGDASLFAKYGFVRDVPYVLFVGTLEPRKGLDVLLAAFERVARDNVDVELWVAGQAGWAINDVNDAMSLGPNATRIRRLGFVDDAVLPALYRQAAVVAYPSRGEGFGLPVLEALACGAYVVTSKDTVMAEIAGNAASLISIGDEESLADELAKGLAMNFENRRERALLARSRAELFTWDASMTQHVKAYDLALGV